VKYTDLLSGAKYLIDRSSTRRPRQADLKRAISSIYYSLFHTLAGCCADMMIGGKNSDRSKPAWRQVYRSLEHGHAKTQCSNGKIMQKFPKEIEDFANWFVTMQSKRHNADYDPFYKTTKSEVLLDLSAVESAIDKFLKSNTKDRRAFSAFVLLKNRS
jgi:uncharacterized protein (UPF0332 family)